MKKLSTVIILLLISMAFGQAQTKKIKMHKNPGAMKQEIAKQIPVGSHIEDAKRIVEANGFKCMLMGHSSFTEMSNDKAKSDVEHRDIDFLYCDKEKGGLICDRRWQTAIVHKDGIVSDILISISLTCP